MAAKRRRPVTKKALAKKALAIKRPKPKPRPTIDNGRK